MWRAMQNIMQMVTVYNCWDMNYSNDMGVQFSTLIPKIEQL